MTENTTQGTMEHRGYTATVRWDEESKCYAGEVLDTWDMIVFYDHTWEKTYQAFRNVLDWHLEECGKNGKEPRLSNREPMAKIV